MMCDLTRLRHWAGTLTLVLVLLVAAGLRFYRLSELPLGLHYDEAANGILADEIARGGQAPVFIPSYTGKEVLFFYWAALWIRLLGATPLTLRLSAALMGVATVGATVWAVRELLDGLEDANWVALIAGALVATSFWHLVLSRYGFRAVSQPLLQALTVGALWRGLRLGGRQPGEGAGRLWLILAGLFCGLTAYTYLAARAFPIPLAAALLTLLIADRGRRRMRWRQFVLFGAVAALALAPLVCYWLTHPGSFFNRAQQVAAGSWREAWAGVWACLRMFFVEGDPYIRFNLPRRPLFDPFTALLSLLGLVVVALPGTLPSDCRSSTSGLRFATRMFLLLSLPVMILPSALATGEITPSNLRVVGLLPFVYVFPALGLWVALGPIRRLVMAKLRRMRHLLSPVLGCLVLTVWGLIGGGRYFGQWATSDVLYYAADGDLRDVASYLNRADLTNTTPYVASIHYRHPTLAFLAEDYNVIRWLRGGKTVVFPAEGEALIVIPRSASQALDWIETVLPVGAQVAAPPGPDGGPAFHAYRVGPEPGLGPTRPLATNLAYVARVVGYDVLDQARAGERTDVAVWWEVLNRPDRGDYEPVAWLTDRWGFVWGEAHPFHYPAEQWTPGERVVDRLSISVALGTPPGDYVVRFGLYSPSGDVLLPAVDEAGRYAGTYVALPLHVKRAFEPPKPGAVDALPLSEDERLDVRSDSLALLGARLETTEIRPGERIYLTLFWQSLETHPPDTTISLALGGVRIYRGAPVHGTYPTSEWMAGEVVVDRYNPRLPRDLPAGVYRLRLRAGEIVWGLGDVVVQAVDRSFERPAIAHPLTATLSSRMRLLGYDLSAEAVMPGETLLVTLYWQALTEVDENYTVFTHLLGPEGSMMGQQDGEPMGGTYPTSLWMAGEVVTDVHHITIRPDATPGEHRLEVGMYVAETGKRLAVADAVADAIPLQTVVILEP